MPERALAAAMFAMLVGLVGVALVRVFDITAHALFVAVGGLAPILLAPVYLVLGYAAGDRRPAMGAVALALVVCQLGWLGGDYAVTGPFRGCIGEATACVELTVASGNLLASNDTPVEAFRSLAGHDPDVIVVQEASAWTEIVQSGVADDYPHRFTDPATLGIVVASRLPILDAGLIDTPGRMSPLVVLDTETGPIVIVGVHLLTPLSSARIGTWQNQSRVLAELVPDLPHPVVVVGDFNATGQHEVMDRLLSAGLRDAHLERGQGLGATWPVRDLVPPVLRIDHALVSPHFDVATFDVVTVPGSDHRGLVTTLVRTGPAPQDL